MRRIINLISSLAAFTLALALPLAASAAKPHRAVAAPPTRVHTHAKAAPAPRATGSRPAARGKARPSKKEAPEPRASAGRPIRQPRQARQPAEREERMPRGRASARRERTARPDRSTSPTTARGSARQARQNARLQQRTSMAVAVNPLRGSYESLLRQNVKTEADGLDRIMDDNDLAQRIARKILIPLPLSPALAANANLPENRRYCRPWTALFLRDLANTHAALFHHPIEVSSAVRTVAYQKQLMTFNHNATSAEGDVASPHLTGATIDISKTGLGRQELSWMRAQLLSLQQSGKIDVEEEFRQPCFHITVYKCYIAGRPNNAG